MIFLLRKQAGPNYYTLMFAGRQWGPPDVAAGGRPVAADGDGQSRDQVRIPQPARGLHEVCHMSPADINMFTSV